MMAGLGAANAREERLGVVRIDIAVEVVGFLMIDPNPNGIQIDRVVALDMRTKSNIHFCGYWQRSHLILKRIRYLCF